MELLTTVFFFLLALIPLVVIHEFGHFIAAKLTGTRADVFSIGMGKRLFGWNKITGFTFGDLPDDWDGGDHTDYRVSLLPLGGYVKIVGMIDESFDTEFVNKTPEPWEFRSKGTLAKVFMISAGVILNILTAFLILWGILFFNGKDIIESRKIAGVAPNSIAEKFGFVAGDEIVKVGGKSVTSLEEAFYDFSLGSKENNVAVEVQRQGVSKTLIINVEEFLASSSTSNTVKDGSIAGFYTDGIKVGIGGLVYNMPAYNSGLQEGDLVVSVGGSSIYNPLHFKWVLNNFKNKRAEIKVLRRDSVYSYSVTPNQEGLIGIQLKPEFVGKQSKIHYGFVESMQMAGVQLSDLASTFVRTISMMFSGKLNAKDAISGPAGIASEAGKSARMGIVPFLSFVAMISMTLGIMNILPFPVLDGGHLVFILIEAVIRREIPVKVKMWAQQIGFVLFLILLVFVSYNDIVKMFFSK